MYSYIVIICEIHLGPYESDFQFIMNIAVEYIQYKCDNDKYDAVYLFLILALKRGASKRGLVPINNNRSASYKMHVYMQITNNK